MRAAAPVAAQSFLTGALGLAVSGVVVRRPRLPFSPSLVSHSLLERAQEARGAKRWRIGVDTSSSTVRFALCALALPCAPCLAAGR